MKYPELGNPGQITGGVVSGTDPGTREKRMMPGLTRPPAPNPESILAAKSVKLRYVSDQQAGISRLKSGRHFQYRDANGKDVKDSKVLARIKALAVPPAWTDVWICPSPDGHLQATGRDARKRKQYRYHARWRMVRDENKFEHLLEFARALPAIRRHVNQDLARPGLTRNKILAAVVRLMETTLARVGNSEYARANQSFGLTTLQNRHVTIRGDRIELDFRAKSRVQFHRVVSDRKLARILKHCRDLPGSELFQYLDEDGVRHAIDSSDVNEYLRQISGREITAKDFRTWAATNLAVREFCALKEEKPSKKGELFVVERVAEQLGNTPSVCRKCYIHPVVISSYHHGSLRDSVVSVRQRSSGIWKADRSMRRLLSRSADFGLEKALKRSIDQIRNRA
jgi:DNA topoisomerase-1